MFFPLYYLLFPYALFVAIWALLSLIGIYHLARFGFHHIGLLLLVVLYLAGSYFLLQVSYIYLAPLDWQSTVTLFSHVPAALPSFGTSY